MGERKVLNFYISPDFDASIIPKMKRDWSKLVEIRMMLPFSLRCDTCGEYMYRGKKFNSKKEMIKGEEYLGIRKFRFIIKCSVCSAEITFKTDPKNSDYECESGASRNFEVWRDTDDAVEAAKKEREDEDKLDAMKSLENRTIDSKIEMDVLDALDEIKSMNQRHERVDSNILISSYANANNPSNNHNLSVISQVQDMKQVDYDKLDDEIIKSVKFKNKSSSSSSSSSSNNHSNNNSSSNSSSSSRIMNRPVLDSEEDLESKPQSLQQQQLPLSSSSLVAAAAAVSKPQPTIMPIVILARKKRKIVNESSSSSSAVSSASSSGSNDKNNNGDDGSQCQSSSSSSSSSGSNSRQSSIPTAITASASATLPIQKITTTIAPTTTTTSTTAKENVLSSLLSSYGDDDDSD